MRCYQRSLNISSKAHAAYENVRKKSEAAIEKYNAPDLGQETQTSKRAAEEKARWNCCKVTRGAPMASQGYGID